MLGNDEKIREEKKRQPVARKRQPVVREAASCKRGAARERARAKEYSMDECQYQRNYI